MIDIIIPTTPDNPLLDDCINSIKKNTSIKYRIIISDKGDSWVEAVNNGLLKSGLKRDIILMDNDVRVLPGWLDNLENYLKKADIIGFKLIRPEGVLDHAGCQVVFDPIRGLLGLFIKDVRLSFFGIDTRGNMVKNLNKYNYEDYVPHCTTSLLYVKAKVFKDIGLMNKLSPNGRYHEDYDFSFRAISKGYRILYTPNKAIHINAGTKKRILDEKELKHLSKINYKSLQDKWLKNKSFLWLLYKNKLLRIRLGKIKLY